MSARYVNPKEGLPPFTPQHLNYPYIDTLQSHPYQSQIVGFGSMRGVESLHTPQPSVVQRIAREKVIHSEDLVLMIQMVLLEMIASIGLRGQIFIERGSFILDNYWNILVVRRPCGAEVAVFAIVTEDIDVSKVENSWAQAQVLDYLVKIASYNGQKYVFGGVTNYQHWRFCCLPNTTELAESDQILLRDDDASAIEFSSACRAVTSSQVYAHDSPELVHALETLLLRAHASPVLPRTSLTTFTHMYLDVSQDKWQWMVLHCEASASLFYPDTASEWYTLLYQIDSAPEVRNVWLARTDTGAMVVLRFPARAHQSWSACVVEAGVWQHVWGVPVRTVRLLEAVALELPFMYQCALEPARAAGQERGHGEHGEEGEAETAGETSEAHQPQLLHAAVDAEKKRNKWTVRRQTRKQAKAAAAAHTSRPQSTYKNRIVFSGLALSALHNSSSTAPDALQLKELTTRLLELADDPLGTARAALSHLVLDRGLCLEDKDVTWGNLGVLPQRNSSNESDQMVSLVPVVTQLDRLQVAPGGPGEAQASLDHMMDLLEAQLRGEE